MTHDGSQEPRSKNDAPADSARRYPPRSARGRLASATETGRGLSSEKTFSGRTPQQEPASNFTARAAGRESSLPPEPKASSIPHSLEPGQTKPVEKGFQGALKWKPTASALANQSEAMLASPSAQAPTPHPSLPVPPLSARTGAPKTGSDPARSETPPRVVAASGSEPIPETEPLKTEVPASSRRNLRRRRKALTSEETAGNLASTRAATPGDECAPAQLARTSVFERMETMTGSVPVIHAESDLTLNQPLPSPRKPRRLLKVIVGVLACLALLVGGVLAVGVAYTGSFTQLKERLLGGADYSGEGTGTVQVEIPKGATGKQIAQILHRDGVIASTSAFVDLLAQNESASKLQAGTYNLREKMSARAALALLLDPKSRAVNYLVVPPGFTIWQVRERLVKNFNFPESQVEAEFNQPGKYVPGATSLEGWLAPSSYPVEKNADLSQIIKSMVELTRANLQKAGVEEGKWYDTLKLGSIIEREVNQKQYYGKVARVVDNRLQANSPTHGLIQMDSTVLYGLGRTGGIPTKSQLQQDTPYNTYLHKGLPPTPIGAVSLDALQAAANPTPGDWIFFVTVNLDSGETVFSSTYEEHKKNVNLLAKWCDANPGKC